ncbi:hypothetical protein PybrP1_011476 [[Pythium] brassicae (nom. inval.)]|nr:hypothetical protein PybrP1_011476 [[Pythium] brassicae (nom. inval.)]
MTPASLLARQFPWRNRALVLRLLCFLHADDVRRLCESHHAILNGVRAVLQRHQRQVARLALALWGARVLQVDFQSRFQVLETRQIARSQSSDPRVEGGTVTLKPSALPLVHGDGLTVHFSVNPSDKPMLTNVVQTQRRIYTMVTVKLLRRDEFGTTTASSSSLSTDGGSSDDAAAIVLRQYSYEREFGEWRTPTAPEKRLFGLQSDAPCRFDLLTRDGSVVLELEVPSGADSLVDYYLVKKAVVNISMAELLQHFFHSLRPTRALPTAATHFCADCVMSY